MTNSIMVTPLSVEDPSVEAVAKHFHWKPETLIDRIEKCLPSKIEQYLYLSITTDFHIRPESFRTLIRMLLGERELTHEDLKVRKMGNNLVSSRILDLTNFIENALFIAGKLATCSPEIGLSMEQAAKLTLLYGEYAEVILDAIMSDITEVGRRMGVRGSDKKIVSLAVLRLIEHTENRARTHLDPVSCEQILDLLRRDPGADGWHREEVE